MKIKGKQLLQALILTCLSSSFIYYLRYTDNGIEAYFALKKENNEEEKKVQELQATIKKLEGTIQQWKNDDFIKEKMAREDLQMSFTNEYTYILPST